jgi:hypothetical protein
MDQLTFYALEFIGLGAVVFGWKLKDLCYIPLFVAYAIFNMLSSAAWIITKEYSGMGANNTIVTSLTYVNPGEAQVLSYLNLVFMFVALLMGIYKILEALGFTLGQVNWKPNTVVKKTFDRSYNRKGKN